MHLGLTPWRLDHSIQALIDQAVFAEQLGYNSFWLPENHFISGAIPDPLMLLASIASATSKIKLATASYLLPLRHPLQAAEQVAVLDQLSGGRVILGVGRGVGRNMLKAFDVEPKDKRDRFEGNLKLMIKAWSGVSVVDNGHSNPTDEVILHPLPIQKPHPEIWVAAFGPKALAQAGRLGLPYFASPLETLNDLIRNFTLHSEACESAGQMIPPIRAIMRRVFVSEDKASIQMLRKQLSKGDQRSQWRAQHAELDDWMLIGNQTFVRRKIEEYQRRLGITHLVVTPLQIPEITQGEQTESLDLIAKALR
jgi:alkanesulfonate monooxygenase SsuD/methylene tetrahydromethanopterin reductase-like flavin-dependent oxidoreductase (luciferase family)